MSQDQLKSAPYKLLGIIAYYDKLVISLYIGMVLLFHLKLNLHQILLLGIQQIGMFSLLEL
jgi:hypothetical protein